MRQHYLEPTQAAAVSLLGRKISGAVTMLKLREVADYSKNPDLCPVTPISGREAYQKYMDHTLPYLKKSGGEMLLLGDGGEFFIGPDDERWDLVMLVKQHSVERFFAFASDPECLKGLGHRTAAVEDSRLLPVTESL